MAWTAIIPMPWTKVSFDHVVVEVFVALVVSLLALVVWLVVSLIVLVVSPPFFASFKILSFNLFMYFSLPLRTASTRFGSFVTFSDVFSMFYIKQNRKDPIKIDPTFEQPVFDSDDDYSDGGYQPIFPKVWQKRALTSIPIVICNMLKLHSKRYLKPEKVSISVRMYNQSKKSKGYVAQCLLKKTCDVTQGQSLAFFIMPDPQFSFKFLTYPS